MKTDVNEVMTIINQVKISEIAECGEELHTRRRPQHGDDQCTSMTDTTRGVVGDTQQVAGKVLILGFKTWRRRMVGGDANCVASHECLIAS
ncbi:hypothetical protein E2C01_102085 [Portunus trituberculatus]|uniref:Uncharacterized protein n=1 Tax=Portunus trituberculatus TaxID=210409 RepID=A0A5B7KBN0_PORTR|nr:hypothetical protein [Portunus trituberculatus]